MPTHKAQGLKTDVRPPVQVKSTRDGLLFVLDEHCEFEPLLEHLNDLLHGETQAVFDGPTVAVAVDYAGRSLNPEEMRSLIRVFMGKENFLLTEWGPQTEARKSLAQSRSRIPGQHIYKGTVRAGQRLVFDGDVVIVGDVNPGGEVVAAGDIYVFGKLAGIAHCGAAGNSKAVIAAAEFVPMQLRIASIISRAPEENGRTLHTFMEFAYIRDVGMAVDKVQYMASVRQQYQGQVASKGEQM